MVGLSSVKLVPGDQKLISWMLMRFRNGDAKPPEVPPMIMLELQGNQGLPPNQGNISRCRVPFFFENVPCFFFQTSNLVFPSTHSQVKFPEEICMSFGM